jgi:hypothetical protein
MNGRPCPDDLLVAARQRMLSELERKALSAHLDRCESCRAGELAAELLHAPLFTGAMPTASDRALVDRVAERASSTVAKQARRAHWGWRRVAVTVAVFLGMGGVASALIGRSFVSPRPVDPVPVQTGPEVGPRVHRGERTPPAPRAAAPAPLPSKRLAAARPVRVGAALATADTAASLFADAARARHDGDLRRAVTLFGALRSTFPDSDQAQVASVSMGDLLIRLGEPARALRAFDAYLSDVRTGPLREEALFGRARCQRELGDGASEAETWARLVRDFPGSAYATAARKRLDELRSAR